MAATILLIDDELDITEINRRYLIKAGYEIVVAFNGKEALERYKEKSFDLVISDIMMPEMDGYELMDNIQMINPDQPFLFITAKSSDQDKIFSLSLGADDFISKPFSPRELVLRVQNILRRIYSDSDNSEVGLLEDLKVDNRTHEVSVNGHKIDVTVKEFELLWILVNEPNRAFSKSEIYQKVWHEEYNQNIDANTLSVHIHDLRSKLSKYGSNKTPKISTVWGLGYKMEV
ncbi:response regulator transcription factor [Weissella cibaria]|uniref:response regulator transcription factor n=1 Tax=Weissella cibaria TaxID=137591 RepID=UPI00106E1CA7|nr:response regulator transcription factor [Weissella cibaria]